MFLLFGGTDTGLVRKANQDRFAFHRVSDLFGYAVLCDGMGGQNGGSVASQTAIDFVAATLLRDLRPDMGEVALRAVMNTAVAGANALVFDAATTDPNLAGMGTTLIVAVFTPGHVFVSYVGDSRVYHLGGDGAETQLTRDHTVVQLLLDIGEIDPEEAQHHPKRHYITRAVGVAPTVDADFLEHPFAPGDTVLLCSDGLYNYYEENTLAELLRQSVAAGSVDNLIGLANERGGGDNITAVVAYWEPDGEEK